MQRNEAIQGLRGIAAMFVVVSHSILTLVEHGRLDASWNQLSFEFGEVGVFAFFIISGFIMTTTMNGEFGRPGATASFLWRRLIRIVPLYYLTTLAVIAVRYLQSDGPPSFSNLIWSFGFFPYRDSTGLFRPIYGLGWTLNYEMFFYLLFALALFLRRATGLWLLLGALALLAASRQLGPAAECSTVLCDAAHFYTDEIILYFAYGVVLASVQSWVAARAAPWAGLTGAAAASALLLAIYFVFVALTQVRSDLLQASVCILVASACALATAPSQPSRVNRVMLGLGDASYSVYLTHSFLIAAAAIFWFRWMGDAPALLYVGAMLVGSAILGHLSFRFVEKPLLDLFRRRRPAHKAADATASSRRAPEHHERVIALPGQAEVPRVAPGQGEHRA